MQYANLDTAQQQPVVPQNRIMSRKSKQQQKKFKRFAVLCGIVLLAFGLFHILPFIFHLTKLFIASPGEIFTVVANRDPDLKQSNGRVNVLLLGTGGEGHDGPDLTDTIMVASVDVKTGDVALFSIPRDVWSNITQSKVNAIYALAREKGNDGLQPTMDAFSNYTGLPIAYAVRLDFAGFEKAIDIVGGITVTVDNTFDDYQYPILDKEHDTCGFVEKSEPITVTIAVSPMPTVAASPKPSGSPHPTASAATTTATRMHTVYVNAATGKTINEEDVTDQNNPYACRYEHIHFDKGIVKMDGVTALKFVRSRHGTNGEGSDFARSKRQQAVISAFRNALISKETLFDIPKITALVQTFGQSIDTNITENEYGDFYQLYRRTKNATLKSVALTDGSDGGEAVFVHPDSGNYGGQWVLVPKGNDWSTVQAAIARLLVAQPTISPIPSPTVLHTTR